MRGQVAIFAVIGLILMIVVGFMLILSSGIKTQGTMPIGSAQQYVQGCLEQGSQEGLLLLGKNGGFASEAKAESHPYGQVNYGFYDMNTLPDIEVGLGWLNRYVESSIASCIDSSGLDTLLLEGDIDAETIVTEKSILIRARIPCAIDEPDQKTKLESFETSLPVRYKDAFEHANRIADSLKGDGVYDTCLAGYGGLDTFILPYSDHDVIVIADPGAKLGGREFRFIYSASKKPSYK